MTDISLQNTIKRKDDFREEIIMKSREIVAKLGYRKASTEEIARSLNRTKGALYHYFDNREEILKAVIKYEGDQLKKAIFEAISIEDDPGKKLAAFFMTRARKILELWNFYKSVIEEYFARYSFIMTALTDYNTEEFDIVSSIISAGIDSSLFAVSDSDLAARAFIKSMKGYDFFMFQGECFEEIEVELAESLQTFIRGMTAR
jgi:AcrR family transcriptional regulator